MKIAFLGDTALFGKNSIEYNPNIFTYFKEVADVLKQFDLVVANLETPFVLDQKPFAPKSVHIKSHPDNIDVLKFLNIRYVNLANNHIYDFGRSSLELTKKILNENEIGYFGVHGIQSEVVYKNNKLALQGYCCYSTNPLGLGSNINILDIDKVKINLLKNSKNGFLNILNMHFGQEHVHKPNYDHLQAARQLSEVCPFILCGHHPHVIQGIEKVKDSLIAYSLGNFCFGDIFLKSDLVNPFVKLLEKNKRSFIWVVEVVDNQIIKYDTIPIYIGLDKIEVGKKEILDDIVNYSEALSLNKEQYVETRNSVLKSYVKTRKDKRDLMWYKNRFSVDSIIRILATRRNRKLYKKYIQKKIESKRIDEKNNKESTISFWFRGFK